MSTTLPILRVRTPLMVFAVWLCLFGCERDVSDKRGSYSAAGSDEEAAGFFLGPAGSTCIEHFGGPGAPDFTSVDDVLTHMAKLPTACPGYFDDINDTTVFSNSFKRGLAERALASYKATIATSDTIVFGRLAQTGPLVGKPGFHVLWMDGFDDLSPRQKALTIAVHNGMFAGASVKNLSSGTCKELRFLTKVSEMTEPGGSYVVHDEYTTIKKHPVIELGPKAEAQVRFTKTTTCTATPPRQMTKDVCPAKPAASRGMLKCRPPGGDAGKFIVLNIAESCANDVEPGRLGSVHTRWDIYWANREGITLAGQEAMAIWAKKPGSAEAYICLTLGKFADATTLAPGFGPFCGEIFDAAFKTGEAIDACLADLSGATPTPAPTSGTTTGGPFSAAYGEICSQSATACSQARSIRGPNRRFNICIACCNGEGDFKPFGDLGSDPKSRLIGGGNEFCRGDRQAWCAWTRGCYWNCRNVDGGGAETAASAKSWAESAIDGCPDAQSSLNSAQPTPDGRGDFSGHPVPAGPPGVVHSGDF